MSDTNPPATAAPVELLLPTVGWLRLKDVLGDPNADPPIRPLVPVGKTAWYNGMERGWYPPPHRFGRGVAFWSASDIRRLVETGSWKAVGEDASAAGAAA